MPQIEQEAREQIAKFLPSALNRALGSYKKFTSQPDFEKPKEFKTQHDASKAALSHIQLLIRLAEKAGLPEKKGGNMSDDQLAELINTAQAEVDRLKKEEG